MNFEPYMKKVSFFIFILISMIHEFRNDTVCLFTCNGILFILYTKLIHKKHKKKNFYTYAISRNAWISTYRGNEVNIFPNILILWVSEVNFAPDPVWPPKDLISYHIWKHILPGRFWLDKETSI